MQIHVPPPTPADGWPAPALDTAPPVRVLLLPDAAPGADPWMHRVAADEDGSLLVPPVPVPGGCLARWSGPLQAALRRGPPARCLVVAEGRGALALLKALRQPGPCPVAAALIVALPDPQCADDPAVASRRPLPVPVSLVSPDPRSALLSTRWALPWSARLLGPLPLPASALAPTVAAWLAGMRRRLDEPAAPPVTVAPARAPQRFAIDR